MSQMLGFLLARKERYNKRLKEISNELRTLKSKHTSEYNKYKQRSNKVITILHNIKNKHEKILKNGKSNNENIDTIQQIENIYNKITTEYDETVSIVNDNMVKMINKFNETVKKRIEEMGELRENILVINNKIENRTKIRHIY